MVLHIRFNSRRWYVKGSTPAGNMGNVQLPLVLYKNSSPAGVMHKVRLPLVSYIRFNCRRHQVQLPLVFYIKFNSLTVSRSGMKNMCWITTLHVFSTSLEVMKRFFRRFRLSWVSVVRLTLHLYQLNPPSSNWVGQHSFPGTFQSLACLLKALWFCEWSSNTHEFSQPFSIMPSAPISIVSNHWSDQSVSSAVVRRD